MAVLDAPRHEAEEVGRLERRVQAQLFLDMLQGAFESAWERPEDLTRALAELPNTAEGEERRRVLSSYLKAMSGCLEEGLGDGGAVVGAGAAAQGRRKRRHRARRRGRGSGSDQEDSDTEDNAALDAKVQHSRGETAVTMAKEATPLLEGGAVVPVSAVPEPAVASGFPSSIGTREGPVARVLMDDDLLGCVFGFLQMDIGRQRVKVLGQLGLVCRTWREMACRERWWTAIGKEVMPGQGNKDGQMNREATRTRYLQYGRMLVEERKVWRFDIWPRGLELHFEVFDRYIGRQLLSARGRPWFVKKGNRFELQLESHYTLEVHETVFSAASLSCRGVRAFAKCMWWDDEDAPGMCVRVTIGDRRTGRKALLWEDGNGTSREIVEPPPAWQSPGTFAVMSQSDVVVDSISQHLSMSCSSCIIFCPDDDEPKGPDKQYTILGGYAADYEDGYGPIRLIMAGENVSRVPSWIMSLLWD